MAHKQIFVELEKVEKENTLNSGRLRGDSHKLWNIPWSCLPLVITLRPEKNCGKCHKNYLRPESWTPQKLLLRDSWITQITPLNNDYTTSHTGSLWVDLKISKTICQYLLPACWQQHSQRIGNGWVSRFQFTIVPGGPVHTWIAQCNQIALAQLLQYNTIVPSLMQAGTLYDTVSTAHLVQNY